MARIYDIAERIKNGSAKPTVKIDEEHVFKINTSLSAVLFIKNEWKEAENDKAKDDFDVLQNIIKIALGEEASNYIFEQDPTMANLSLIVNVIMAAISDISLEEMESADKADVEAKKSGKKSK